MKSNHTFLLAIFSLLFFITSCKNDNSSENPSKVTGTFSVDTTTYNFKGSFGFKFGADTGTTYTGFNIDLYLFSEGVSLAYANGGPYSFAGKGASIYLESFSSNESLIADGTYLFSTNSPYPINSFSDLSDFGLGDFSNDPVDYVSITGGSYTISTLSDGKKNINLNLDLDNGKKLTGTFTGPISLY